MSWRHLGVSTRPVELQGFWHFFFFFLRRLLEIFNKSNYIYIFKSWSVAFIVTTLQLSHISVYVIIFFLFNFPKIVFNVYFFNIYTSPTFFPPLHFHLLTTSPTFLSLLSFHLFTTLYNNIILPLSPYLLLFLFLLIHNLLL